VSVPGLVRRLAPYTLDVALAFSVLGMMLIIAGVLTSGLFLPGVVLIGVGILKFAAAAVFAAAGWSRGAAE
jgi:hypothetical protein